MKAGWFERLRARLGVWLRDFFGGSKVERLEEGSISPFTALPQALAILGAIFADPVMKIIGVESASAVTVFRVGAALVLLALGFYVVTAKKTETVNEGGPLKRQEKQKQKYSFSNTDRAVAKACVALVAVAALWVLGRWWFTVPDCRLNAIVEVQKILPGVKPSLLLARTPTVEARRYPIPVSGKVALQLPGEHASSWSLVVLWSDGSESEFARLAGCPSGTTRGSADGKAKVTLR